MAVKHTARMELLTTLNNKELWSGLNNIPRPRSLARAVQQRRKKSLQLPDLPTEWKNLVLPDEYKTR